MTQTRIHGHYTEAEDGTWTATAQVGEDRTVATFAGSLNEAKTAFRKAVNDVLRDGEKAEVVDHVDEGDFFEEDEPLKKLLAAFEAGDKGVTAPPLGDE